MDIGFVWWTSLKSHDILFWFSVLCMSERGRKPAIEEYNFGLCKSANMDATIVLVSIFSSSRSIDMREIKLCHLYSGRSIKVAATKAHCPNLLPVRHRILLICLLFIYVITATGLRVPAGGRRSLCVCAQGPAQSFGAQVPDTELL